MKISERCSASRGTVRRLLSICISTILVFAMLFSVMSFNACALMRRENAIIYLSNGEYKAVTSLSPIKTAVIGDADFDAGDFSTSDLYRFVSFGQGGKYAYFCTDMESFNSTTLNRIEIAKMDNRHMKGGKLADEVCEGVRPYYLMYEFGDGTLLFLDESDLLCYFDGKDVTEFDSTPMGGNDYGIASPDKSILLVRQEGSVYSIYRYTNADPETKQQVAASVEGSAWMNDGTTAGILYPKGDQVYFVGFSGEPQKVCEDANLIYCKNETGTVYYTERTGSTVTDGQRNTFDVNRLCSWSVSGEKKVYAEDVISCSVQYECILFNTKSIFEGYYTDYSRYYPGSVVPGQENSILIYATSEVVKISDTAALQHSNLARRHSEATFIAAGATLFLFGGWYMDSYQELYYAEVKDGAVDNLALISSKSTLCGANGDTLYYASNFNDYGTTCDIKSCDKDGNLYYNAQGIYPYQYTVYTDGCVVGYNNSRELVYFENSKEKVIADNVTMFIRTNAFGLLYISDGDLYFYNGHSKTRIDKDVDYVWSSTCADAVSLRSDYIQNNPCF